MKCGVMLAKRIILAGCGAIDHQSGKLLVYMFGRRKDEVFLQLKALLERLNQQVLQMIGSL